MTDLVLFPIYIYNIGVLTVNIEFMWRGLETGERPSLSEFFLTFRAELLTLFSKSSKVNWKIMSL